MDPLARAAIEIVATEGSLEVVGFAGGESVTVPAGQGLSLPPRTPTESESGGIFTPDPIGGGVVAVVVSTENIELITERQLTSLRPGEPVVYSIPKARTIDLRHFRAAAMQATEYDRRLMIVAGRVQDVGD